MSHIDQLVEQHFRESESHLRHIDEMLEKAHKARERNQLGAEPDLTRIDQNRMRLVQELHGLRNEPKPASEDVVQRSKGLSGMLQSIGSELEKALVAVVDKNPR